MNLLRRLTLLVVAIVAANGFQIANAAEPDGYYSKCEGKTGQALLTALYQTITEHTTVSYDGLWTVYKTSDVYPGENKIWDMYSTKHWSTTGGKCGNYSYVGDCYNREHSFPKSWFNDARPMYSDAYHIYPTDGKVNGQRSNYPYGECANGTTLPSKGGVDALGKLGKSTFSGYSGTVFEPIDEYKGDFARSYFYMATCYNDRIASWKSDMLANNAYPCFSNWALNLLLKWHRQDAVSKKETDRNEAVSSYQKNRNPFIDHPELVEYIWGTKKGVAWYPGGEEEGIITTPSDGSTVNIGLTAVGVAKTYAMNVAGRGLKENVTVSLTGSSTFNKDVTTLTADAVNNGTATINIKYLPTAAETSTATLTLTSGDETVTVNLTATAVNGIPAGEASEVTEDSFIANWVNISGDATYKLYVNVNGSLLPGYPVDVKASAEKYTVTGLTPSTAYSYYLTYGDLTSEVIDVTTADPAPSIQFLYDGELYFTAVAGEPSEVAELLVEIENISENVVVSVTEPFQVSTDKTNWSTAAVLLPGEDRIYLRLMGQTTGDYTTELVAEAGTYKSESVTIKGKVTRSITAFAEDFESNSISCYSTGVLQGDVVEWYLSDAGTETTKAYLYSGNQAIRFGKTSSSSLSMNEDKAKGLGEVSFYARNYGSDNAAVISVEYSMDGGATWTAAGTATLTNAYEKYSYTVNKEGAGRIRLKQTSGKRADIDLVEISDYTSGIEEVADYHTWDAYSLNGELVIENSVAGQHVNVYSVNGITEYSGELAAGNTTVKLAKGLYIVVIDNFARRVVVK